MLEREKESMRFACRLVGGIDSRKELDLWPTEKKVAAVKYNENKYIHRSK